METTISLSIRDLLMFAAFVLVRDGFPFLMRTWFPNLMKNKADQIVMDSKIKERELELRKEIAERDRIHEERQTRAIESIESTVKDLTGFIAKNYAETSILATEARQYFAEGRQSMKQIAVMSSVRPKKK